MSDPLPATGPNAEQIDFWNRTAGARWVAMQAAIDATLAPLGLAAMERARVRSGERALDVGCGCGHTSLQLGERVGAGGRVLGVDLSAAMLERARLRAREAGTSHVRFEIADAQHRRFETRFDLVYSRLGVMFFADPTAAFANLGRALRPDGRIAFVCWQPLARNPWLGVPLAAAARHLPLPEPPAPGAPGPFSLSDPVRLCDLLHDAGYARIAVEPLEGRLLLGGGESLDTSVDFALRVGPTARALLQASESQPDLGAPVTRAVREALAPHFVETPDRVGVELDYAAWIVTAERRGP